MIQQRLQQLDPDFNEKENLLKANHEFFILIGTNFEKHQKLLEALNRSYSTSLITSSNYKRVTFETFMKQPVQWRNVRESKLIFELFHSSFIVSGSRCRRFFQVEKL